MDIIKVNDTFRYRYSDKKALLWAKEGLYRNKAFVIKSTDYRNKDVNEKLPVNNSKDVINSSFPDKTLNYRIGWMLLASVIWFWEFLIFRILGMKIPLFIFFMIAIVNICVIIAFFLGIRGFLFNENTTAKTRKLVDFFSKW